MKDTEDTEEKHFFNMVVVFSTIVVLCAGFITYAKIKFPENKQDNQEKVARIIKTLIPGALTSFESNNVVRIFNPQTKTITDYNVSLKGVITGGIVVTNY